MSNEEIRKRGRLFSGFLRLDGTGAISMNINGASENKVFSVSPGEGRILLIDSVTVTVRDNTPFVAGGFGAMAALTNGMQVLHTPDTGAQVIDRTAERVFKSTNHLASIADTYSIVTVAASDVAHISRHILPDPIVVRNTGTYAWKVRDDLTGLFDFTVYIKGVLARR